MITYNAEGIAMPKIKKRLTSKWIKAVAASHGRKVGEVGYLVVNDDKILEVNREYLGHDYYTDIITFDYDEDDVINGDLVISLDTVRTNAEQFAKSYDDELHRVIIHGILHLLGYDHVTPEQERQMFGLQRQLLLTFLAVRRITIEPATLPKGAADALAEYDASHGGGRQITE